MTRRIPAQPTYDVQRGTQREVEPNITITPALPSDASDLATVTIRAYGPDLIFSLLVPDMKARHGLLKEYFESMCGTYSGATVLKAVDDDKDQKIVGVMLWSPRVVYANDASSPTGWHEYGLRMNGRESQPPIENDELAMYMAGHIGTVEMKWIILRRCDVLDQIAVDPAYQRKGIGTALIQVATERADNERLSLWACSTPQAYAFFSSCGWNTAEEWPIDLSRFTEKDSGYGIYKQSFMLRLPSKDFGEAGTGQALFSTWD